MATSYRNPDLHPRRKRGFYDNGTRTGVKINANIGKPSPMARAGKSWGIGSKTSFDEDREKAAFENLSPAEKQGRLDAQGAAEYRKGRYGDVIPAYRPSMIGPSDETPVSRRPASTPASDKLIRGAIDSISTRMDGPKRDAKATGFAKTTSNPSAESQKSYDRKQAKSSEAMSRAGESGVVSRSDNGDVAYESGGVYDVGGKKVLVSKYGSGSTGVSGGRNDSGKELRQMIADGRASVPSDKRIASRETPNPKSPLTLLASANPPTGPSKTRSSIPLAKRLTANSKPIDPAQAEKAVEGSQRNARARSERMVESQLKPKLEQFYSEQKPVRVAAAKADLQHAESPAMKAYRALNDGANSLIAAPGNAIRSAGLDDQSLIAGAKKLFTGDTQAAEEAKRRLKKEGEDEDS